MNKRLQSHISVKVIKCLVRCCMCITLIILSLTLRAQSLRVGVDMRQVKPAQLQQCGIALDCGVWQQGDSLFLELSPEEQLLIQEADLPHRVVSAAAMLQYFRQQTAQRGDTAAAFQAAMFRWKSPEHFSLGSLGGYFTYEEILAHLDNLHNLRPDLVSEKQPIGNFQTFEGRPLYYLTISNHPAAYEPNDPAILFTALHHAREPISVSQLIFFMYYLIENYDNDALLRQLVDNSNLFFVPCVNPDGVVFNESLFDGSTTPPSFGYWRKNRRDHGNGTFGVDLNRNYGYQWGYDDNGSSGNTGSALYRGAAPFSEPETQAIRYLCEQYPFKIALNYHSYGNYLLYPFGYSDAVFPTDALHFDF
ncbi:MAG: zinc carboxypeptidase [Sphingobacteriales bacterium]|nr:zinc carboxypeptidase [Sphingobacteriales bacterium]